MKKRHIVRALALLLGMAMLLAYPAAAVDLNASCTVTVEANSTEYADDLEKADVVIDLYRVADAAPVGENGYELLPTGVFSDLVITDAQDSDEWQVLTQEAAELALALGSPTVSDAPLGEPITLTNGGTPLSTGLYLMIARGRGVDDYSTTVLNDREESTLVTVAMSDDYEYLFAPQLLAIPAEVQESAPEEAPVPEGGESGQPVTDGTPDIIWVYDVDVALKLDRLPLYSDIEVFKTLTTYEAAEPATFVFDVQATLDGTMIYSNVASLTFTAPGTKSVLLQRIPVGAMVTVREVYSGAHYSLQSAATQTATIVAGTTARVDFVNEYNGSATGGHGITNNFTYDGYTWVWVQKTGNDQ